MYFSSPARTRLALGPGRAVLILGPAVAVMVFVVMEILRKAVVSGQWSVSATSATRLVSDARRRRRIRAEDFLVATEEAGTKAGRQIGAIAARTHQAVQPALG